MNRFDIVLNYGIGMKDNEEGVENPNQWQGLNLLGEALMKVRAML